MIKTLFSKVSGNVYDGDHVDHVEVEQNLLDHSKDQGRTYEEEVVVEQNLLDHPKDLDRTHEEEVVEVRRGPGAGGNTTTEGGGGGA